MSISTQKDVAMAAKVSQALVSLVLAEAREGTTFQSRVRVSSETRQAILDAANRLGYHSKAVGRRPVPTKSLLYLRRVEGRQAQSGNASMDSVGEALQNAMIEEVSRQGFTLTVRTYDQPGEILSSGLCDSLDGVFLGMPDPELIDFFAPSMPVITLREKPLIASDVVVADDHDIIDRALECLSRHGHTRIALLTADPDSKLAARRDAAFTELSEHFGICPCAFSADCFNAVDFLNRFLDPSQAEDSRPTALIAEEVLALSIQNEAIRRGLSLPDDLSIVSLGHSAASAFSSPPLTTVAVAPGEIAQATLSLMVERIETSGLKCGHRKIEVAARLIERASVTGPDGAPSSSNQPLISLSQTQSNPQLKP